MKKILNLFLIIVSFFALASFEEPDVGDVKNTYTSVDRTNLSYLCYHRQNHAIFGEIKQISGEVRKSSRIIQDNWLVSDVYDNIPDILYSVYEFEKYVDVPISIKSVTKLDSGQKIERSRETIYSEEFVNSQITSSGVSYLNSFSVNFNYNYGIDLDVFEFGSSLENEILIESELNKKFTYSKNYKYSFEEKITESETWQNDYSFPIYYQCNYRQKFKMYFVNVYQYQYEVRKETEFGCTKYSYINQGLLGLETYYTLVPVDPPYYHVSKYYDNEQGVRVPLNLSHSNIVYI